MFDILYNIVIAGILVSMLVYVVLATATVIYTAIKTLKDEYEREKEPK
jgi:uncharacterized protein with GYD domain